MFGKIMKYEMKSSMKLFLIIWAGLLAVALAGGFLVNSKGGELADNYFIVQNLAIGSGGAINTLMILLYVALAIGIVALSLIFIIQRFNKGLLGREGYLMFTLPVKTRTLILGKCVSAAVVVVLSILAGLLSILLFVLPSLSGFGEIKEVISGILDYISYNSSEFKYLVPCIVLMVVMAIMSVFKFIYQVYASVSIGHLFDRHKTLMSVVAYVGICIVEGIAGTAVIEFIAEHIPFFRGDWNADFGDPETLYIFGGVIVAQIVCIVIYHIVTEAILKNKLNLE